MDRRYADTLQYLYENLPMFQRIGAAALKRDLGNTLRLCEYLGNPHKTFRTIHVAGTNGKGSCAHLLASTLFEAGYKTGLYTSPHLKEFTERIRVDGQEADRGYVAEFVDRMRPIIDKIRPSFFEITVVMAFDYFARQHVDVAVIEVGLGGRLDSTNVIEPELSLITNIGWDHKDILGDTLEKIASEKAGIIKHQVPAVISERQSEIADVFIRRANEMVSSLSFASDHYQCVEAGGRLTLIKDGEPFLSEVDPALKGGYQKKNLAGVACTVDILNSHGFSIHREAFRRGIERVIANTSLKGRWQRLRERPLMICDTGHNEDGIRAVVRQITETPHANLHLVFGMVKDKDAAPILSLLPRQASYYFCQSRIPRALDAGMLCEKAREFGLQGEVIPDVNEAKERALEKASPDDLIFIGGSTFVVAEIAEL